MRNIKLLHTVRATFGVQSLLLSLPPEETGSHWFPKIPYSNLSSMKICLSVFSFSGLNLWHMEVPRLGVES